jgi:hypothetical protein
MTLVCKDMDDKILSDERQILERWQQYFKALLNPESARINSINIHEGPINNPDPQEPTYNEIDEIIKKLKPNKPASRIYKK